MRNIPHLSLYDSNGKRKYLTQEERNLFLDLAQMASPEIMTFCMVLAYTGARISETLALTPAQVDFELQCIMIECAKKQKKGIFRAVPVPINLLKILDNTHSVKEAQSDTRLCHIRLWPWGRTAAWSYVREIMSQSGMSGIHATPKGLRHAFGVAAIHSGISLNMVQKWMGHADMETTAIYANAVGVEELQLAGRLWEGFAR